MLLVLANTWDPRGAALCHAWESADARLATSADLSQVGWSFEPSAPETGYAVIDRQRVPVKDIAGICVLMPAVTESDLPHIAASDRIYVAAEMTAFLGAWLSSLPCPTVNPPAPGCLCGPNWRRERWIQLAARLGLPTRAAVRCVGAPDPRPPPGEPGQTVVVAAGRIFGEVDQADAGWAARLAAAAATRLLSVHIGHDADGTFLLGADIWADVSRPGVPEALLGELTGRMP
jgi:hypothetical protein